MSKIFTICVLFVFLSCAILNNPFLVSEYKERLQVNTITTPVPIDYSKTYKLINVKSGYLLTVTGVSTIDGANVNIRTNLNNSCQSWIFFINFDQHLIINSFSGKLLDVDHTSKLVDGANVYQWQFIGNPPDQLWDLICVDNFDVYIVKNVSSGFVLAAHNGGIADGTNVVQNTYTGDNSQHWRIILY